MFYFARMNEKQNVLRHKPLVRNKQMDVCLSVILDEYDVTRGYDPHEIQKITNEFRDLLENGYDTDEVEDYEIDDIIEACTSLAKDTIGTLFAAGKESRPCQGINRVSIEESLNRLVCHVGDSQRSEEWFMKRHQMLTASIAGSILKVDIPKNKGIAIIRDKITPFMEQTSETDKVIQVVSIPQNPDQASVRGNRYEPVIREAYARLLPDTDPSGAVVEYDCVQHREYPFLGASPDGIVMKGPMRGRMVEIKCPMPNSISKDGNKVRHEYWCQMQLQMEVCDLPQCDYVRAVVWDSETSEDAERLLREKQAEYQNVPFNPEIGKKDSHILIMGTVWMNGLDGQYVYEPPGQFVDNDELYIRENCNPAFIRHYFILSRDWMVIRVERNRDWFNHTFLPKAREVWEEVLRGRENVDEWMSRHPKRQMRGGVKKNEREYTSTNAMFVDSD